MTMQGKKIYPYLFFHKKFACWLKIVRIHENFVIDFSGH